MVSLLSGELHQHQNRTHKQQTQGLTFARAQGLQAGLVAQGVLAGLHHQRKTAVDVLLALLLRAKPLQRHLNNSSNQTGSRTLTTSMP